ncbi:HAAS signaling domain-containing protein [Methanobacterium ferruginis]|jgi:uncharacterized membrane protein|uniref:HAAS signaling domain-containing protein n=1 Tax=Methanobacterium ferruginis TaxID=710191 RepID=UPI002572EA2A|nr:DUF1700 domain-containing protein [Methanobacterium ferruginis]MCC7551229.1 DUF1700 domain-containing protein [Methanobacterium sp.]BDZ67042.1 hypothetical protein GCM10025860_04900 [Methanobacterium ferruginis]
MNKDEYIEELNKLLKKLPKEEKADIISDYEEHFMIGIEKGRTEEEISEALGNPKNLAKQIKAEYMLRKAEDKQSAGSVFEAALAAAGLGIFNLIFVAVPAMLLVAILLTLFVLGGAMVFGGIYVTLVTVLKLILPQYNFYITTYNGVLGSLGGILYGIGLTILGLALLAVLVYVTKWIYGLALRYLKWNLRVIEGKKRS